MNVKERKKAAHGRSDSVWADYLREYSLDLVLIQDLDCFTTAAWNCT